MRAFRVPPGHFVQLHKGTWHAGPLWGRDPSRVFFNLEQHDTNLTDHTTVNITEDGEGAPLVVSLDTSRL